MGETPREEENQKTPEQAEPAKAEELTDWQKKIEEREGEPHEVFAIRSLLEITAKGLEDGYISSVDNVEILAGRIEEARSQGVDLSAIKRFGQTTRTITSRSPYGRYKIFIQKNGGIKRKR